MTSSRPTSAALPREAVERIYRLGPMQAGMLYHELLSPGASPYFRQVSFSLRGMVDPGLCEAAWNALLARHPLMRSLFDHERTAQPLQIVLKAQTVDFAFHALEGPDAAATVEAWRRADARRGFDLSCDRLIRIALFRLGPDRFEMVWSHPHILLDGWSGAILCEEFAQLYAALRQGATPDLPPAPDPDALIAARAALDDAAARRHWAALLDGYEALATLQRLPGTPGPPRPAEHRFGIGEDDTRALRRLAGTHDATLGVLLQALWGLLLGRWTDRRDVVFGIAVSGRSVATPGIERLVGMFINTVPVRVRWSDTDTFGDLLADLRCQAEDGFEHDGTALAEIQAASLLPHGLLDHILVLENYPVADASADTGFTLESTIAHEQANYDFGVLVHAGASLGIALPHDAARLSRDQMMRLEQHWRTLVAAVLADPRRCLAEIDTMPDAERRTLAAFARGPVMPRPATASLAALWRAQVARTPDAPALVFGADRLDYRTLDALAEGVALRLDAAAVVAGDIVGVLAARGPWRIAALLGILKAGAVALPLSPALPDGRLAFVLDDCRCRRVLADADGAARLDRLRPGAAMPIAGPPGAARRARAAGPDDLAYIIHTSGSTGRPKGVEILQSGVVNMILAQIDGFGIEPDDRVLQFASCSFDASLSEIFMALLRGACLVVAPEAAVRDGAALLALLEAERVTVATLPPSYLRALDGAALASLRVLIMAGEAADRDDARRHASTIRTFNAYGPSEASVCASWHRVDPNGTYPAGVPIGLPIANTTMSVRDRRGRPMPFGAPGEICLSGAGLARGYIGDAASTAERFPIVAGERLYRTGDLGLVREDGAVLYLGRVDGQVKLNGHRVELGEIEHRLRADPAVAQAAAVVTDAPARLVAFVVPRGRLDAEALREALARDLPAWMRPSLILPVDTLPRGLSGKLDRRALAASLAAPAAAPAPLGPDEALVAEAFAAVLGGGPHGGPTSFIAAGGDSLRAIRLLGRLRRDGFVLDLRAMLAADTVAAIARGGRHAAAGEDEPVIGPVPLTPSQHWYFDADPHGTARLDHLVLLRIERTSLDGNALAAALEALWRHHDALRLAFERVGARWTGRCAAPDERFAPRTLDLTDIADPWAALAADAEANPPAQPSSGGALLRATLYRLAEADHLLLAAHHLLVDALSWRLVVEDLGAALRQAVRRQTIRLPRKTTSLRDWTGALASVDGLAAAERERAYWTAVATAPVAQSAAVPRHGYDETTVVSADIGAADPSLPERHVLALLLARLGAAMHRHDGREAMHVTLTSHGRRPLAAGLDASRTVGWLAVEYPFLLDCRATVAEIEAALAAVPSQGVGWGVLRWLSAHPVALPEPAVSLNYLGAIDTPADPDVTPSDRLPATLTRGLERRRHLEIEVFSRAGRLTIGVRTQPSVDSGATIRALIEGMANDGLEHP